MRAGTVMGRDLHLAMALATGFVAFSLPLLFHDTRHLWSAETPSLPPSPPEYVPHYGHDADDDSASARFRRACADGDLAKARAIVDVEGRGVISDEGYHGNTPIFDAARGGFVELTQWLLQQGAEADKPNQWGDTPAQEAATMGHFEVVWLLAAKGADLTRTHDTMHNGVLLSAVRHRSLDALQRLARLGVDLSQKHWNGNTVLHEAARSGETPMVRWLAADGRVDKDQLNESGESPIAEAATMGHFEVVDALLELGASIGTPGSRAQAALVLGATRHSRLGVLDTLRRAGASLNEPDAHGYVPILEAVRSGELGTVEWLLHHGANASAAGANGESALAAAAHHGHFDMMWLLHERGADLHALSEHGSSALMSAVYHQKGEEVHRPCPRPPPLPDRAPCASRSRFCLCRPGAPTDRGGPRCGPRERARRHAAHHRVLEG